MPAEPFPTAPGEVLRVLVQVPAAYPELIADLEQMPPRARAERLRALALIGLAVLRGGMGRGGPPAEAIPTAPAIDEQMQEHRLKLFSAIGVDDD